MPTFRFLSKYHDRRFTPIWCPLQSRDDLATKWEIEELPEVEIESMKKSLDSMEKWLKLTADSGLILMVLRPGCASSEPVIEWDCHVSDDSQMWQPKASLFGMIAVDRLCSRDNRSIRSVALLNKHNASISLRSSKPSVCPDEGFPQKFDLILSAGEWSVLNMNTKITAVVEAGGIRISNLQVAPNSMSTPGNKSKWSIGPLLIGVLGLSSSSSRCGLQFRSRRTNCGSTGLFFRKGPGTKTSPPSTGNTWLVLLYEGHLAGFPTEPPFLPGVDNVLLKVSKNLKCLGVAWMSSQSGQWETKCLARAHSNPIFCPPSQPKATETHQSVDTQENASKLDMRKLEVKLDISWKEWDGGGVLIKRDTPTLRGIEAAFPNHLSSLEDLRSKLAGSADAIQTHLSDELGISASDVP